jgi:hypothetical protein
MLLNDSSPTRYNPVNGNLSAINLSLANSVISSQIEWNTLPEYNSSDNWLIMIQLFHQSLIKEPINK